MSESTSNLDWRTSIPETRRRIIRGWYWTIAATVLCVLIVGGVTRLTRSGLSMVEWQPILGVIPPLNEADWQYRFHQYQQYPEYQKLNTGMSLAEFKFIFFWEYLHRLLARAIGIVFLIPFLFFLVKRWMNKPLAKRSLALFALGAMQGLMGWLMVASGLVDRPSVSHYRLAAHLSLAFIIFGYAVWLAREMALPIKTPPPLAGNVGRIKSWHLVVGGLLAAQIVWGAFVAGLKAGFFANTFPLMGGRLIPATLLHNEPALANFVANPVTVQWTHRVLGTLLALAALVLFRAGRHADERTRVFCTALLLIVLMQYMLGVLTLVYVVPVALGVMHQSVALILFGLWVAGLHHLTAAQRLPSFSTIKAEGTVSLAGIR